MNYDYKYLVMLEIQSLVNMVKIDRTVLNTRTHVRPISDRSRCLEELASSVDMLNGLR